MSAALPRLVATVIARGGAEADAAIRRASESGADTIELRVDPPGGSDGLEESLARARSLGLETIVTCRTDREGGTFAGPDAERIDLLRRGARAGCGFVDVGCDRHVVDSLGDLPEACGLIVSRHDPSGTPADLAAVTDDLVAMARSLPRRPACVKVVPTARTLTDNLAVRDLLRARRPVPVAAFAMGAAGIPSRLLALAWGSSASYFAAEASRPAAPGQIGVDEASGVYRVREIRPDTRLFGIVGRPLGHSLSPLLHNAAYEACGLDARYLPFESARLEDFLGLARSLGLEGASVTAPHKIDAARFADELDETARATGAVNTLSFGDGRLAGANTDAAGGIAPLLRRGELRGRRVLLLGAGGAARALGHALRRQGAEVTVSSRTASRAREVAEMIGGATIEPSEIRAGAYDILINATPVGQDDPEQLPLAPDRLGGRLIFDLVYPPRPARADRPTRLIREGAVRGIEVVDGREMLVEQAVAQFRIWFRPPERLVDTARSAMLAACGGPR